MVGVRGRVIVQCNDGCYIVFSSEIIEREGELQANKSPGYSWLIFDGAVGDPLQPLSSSSTKYTITADDHTSVRIAFFLSVLNF